MKILSLHGLAEFREMKYTLKLSDGNLSSHLRALEEEGYVIPHKEFVGKRVSTTYELTSLGRSKFEEFVNQMQSVLA
jgi:DNA-binding HxlR family transcriptional regulator